MMTPAEVFNGGDIKGVHVDPVTLLIHGLALRFAPLDEEGRLRAANELLSFVRRPGETIDALVSRFEVIRVRARTEGGGAQMSVESMSLLVLRACGVNQQQFMQLTQPWQNRLPSTENDFGILLMHLRRMGHILEHFPGNIAATLHGGATAQRPPAQQQQAFFGDGSAHHAPTLSELAGPAPVAGNANAFAQQWAQGAAAWQSAAGEAGATPQTPGGAPSAPKGAWA